jgi:hypothetical protein
MIKVMQINVYRVLCRALAYPGVPKGPSELGTPDRPGDQLLIRDRFAVEADLRVSRSAIVRDAHG